LAATIASCGVEQGETSQLPAVGAGAVTEINGPATVTKQAERLSLRPASPGTGLTLLDSRFTDYVKPEQMSVSCQYTDLFLGTRFFHTVLIEISGLDPDPTPNDLSIDGGRIDGTIRYNREPGSVFFRDNADANGNTTVGYSAIYESATQGVSAADRTVLGQWQGILEIYSYDAYEFNVPLENVDYAKYQIDAKNCTEV
jgi:hypothetical protein